MIREQRDTTWLLLCILVCLFILSAISPDLWTWATGGRSLDELLQIAHVTCTSLTSHTTHNPSVAVDSADWCRAHPLSECEDPPPARPWRRHFRYNWTSS